MARPDGACQREERGGVLTALLLIVVVLGLAAGVLYLASNDNYRHYRLTSRDNHLVIERGRRLPLGFAPFAPDTPALQRAYAPIEMPPNAAAPEAETFDDRADLDRALFTLLAGWGRTRITVDDPEQLAMATTYIERAGLLPGLSEEQRFELRGLRADLAYTNGRHQLKEALRHLEAARAAFKASQELGASRPTDAGDWVSEIDKRFSMLKELGGEAPPKPVPAPAATPPPDEPL